MKNLVVLTGAGMSVESGLSTFRDAGGLWDKYPVMQVASIEGYLRDPGLVIDFYNQRRKELLGVQPNDGHRGLAALEAAFRVTVITQNVDDLHERAGSTRVVHPARRADQSLLGAATPTTRATYAGWLRRSTK